MTHLIDKNALVAEIENLANTYKKCPTRNSYEDGLKDGRLIGYEDALNKINILEVKEVDLEKEIDKELETRWRGEYLFVSKFSESAKHFFELGMQVNNKMQEGE